MLTSLELMSLASEYFWPSDKIKSVQIIIPLYQAMGMEFKTSSMQCDYYLLTVNNSWLLITTTTWHST